MKNTLIYYLSILVPVAIFIWVFNVNTINPNYTLALFLFYILIYRTYTDGKRLLEKEIIEKKEIWKMIIPGYHIKYFRELYLN